MPQYLAAAALGSPLQTAFGFLRSKAGMRPQLQLRRFILLAACSFRKPFSNLLTWLALSCDTVGLGYRVYIPEFKNSLLTQPDCVPLVVHTSLFVTRKPSIEW